MAGTLLYGMGKDSKGAAAFITRLLHGATAVHMHHIAASSFAQHMALGEVYEGLTSAADSLAESYIGCSDQSLAFASGAFELSNDPIAEVQGLYEFVEGNRMMMGMESHIQNEVDGICTLLSSGLYKLKRLA
jgi:hypothetical protein